MDLLNIIENKITYSGTEKNKGAFSSCKPFQIRISDMKYIAMSPRMALDDEECFLIFVDKKHNLFKLPLFHTENISEVVKYFQLKIIGENYNKYFSYESHYGKVDKIIYPNRLFLEDLFYNDWKIFIRGLYSWILPKSFFGNIIDYDN
ncbi:MAG: hypothetical protein V3V28_08200 [Polaribacter sp.]|uniref:hypothetical protein n=1 Tax=Polaribacter sp. TaxID=1920175 RepID=UPI002F34F5F2